jgi:NAD(P)-dependent dehydrogenase (short-subunit alcohol dehydrogenase family)
MQLTDAVVLVTGASAGIGRVAAARFAARGARILVHGRDPERTRQVADEVRGRAVLGDLAVAADRHRIAAEAVDAFGRVDVLVNNAGFGYLGPVSVMDVDVIRRFVEVNLLASIELTRSLLPRMMEQTAAPSASSRRSQGAQVWPVKRSTRRPRQVSTPSPTVCGARPPDPAPTSASSFPAWSTLEFFETRGSPYVRTFPRPIPAGAVADAVVRAVQRDRAEEWRPRWLRIAPTVRALAPGAFRRLAVRFGGSGS